MTESTQPPAGGIAADLAALHASLDQLDRALALAETGVGRGAVIDLEGLDDQVAEALARIGELEGAIGRSFVPDLTQLVERIDRLGRALADQHRLWTDPPPETTPGAAASAYRRRGE